VVATEFVVITILTVVAARLFLYAYPISSPTLGRFRVHHYMYGIIGIPVSILIVSLPMFAVSTALLIDELTFLSIGGKTHEDNYSLISLAGTVGLTIAVCVFREQFVSIFLASAYAFGAH
jgi:hypothetical protein